MKLIQVNPNERVPFFLLLVMFFSIVAANITANSVRDTVFLIQFDKSYLPLMYIVVAIVMAGAMAIYKLISTNRDLISLITYFGLLFAASLIAVQAILSGYVIPCLFVWIDIIAVISMLQFWILAGEIVNTRDAKRIFPLLGIGGSLAGIGAGFSIEPFVHIFGAEKLLFLTATFIGVSVLTAQGLRSRYALAQIITSPSHSPTENSQASSFGPYIKDIAVLIGLGAFISKIVDYQFKMTAAATYPLQEELVTYFGTFYSSVGAATLLMQLFLTGFILSRFGILAGLLLLPIAICIGSSGFLISGTLFAVFLAKFSDQVFKFSTNSAVKEILWLPVTSQKKKTAKPIIDGTIRSGLEGLAGLLIFLLVSLELIPTDKLQWLSIPVIGGVLIWFWNSIRLKDGYVSSLISAIEDRRLSFEDIEYDINDSHVVETIETALTSEDEHTQLFALNLLETLPIDPWRQTVNSLFVNGTQEVKRAALNLSWKDESTISNQQIRGYLSTETPLTPWLIMCASERNIQGFSDTIRPLMSSEEVSVRTVAAIQISTANPTDIEAQRIVSEHYENSDPRILCGSLQYLKNVPAMVETSVAIKWLTHESYDLRNEALQLIKSWANPEFLYGIVSNLSHLQTRNNAIHALTHFDNTLVAETFRRLLFDENAGIGQIEGIVRAIPPLNCANLANELLELLSAHNLELAEQISDALLNIRRQSTLDDKIISAVDSKIEDITKHAYFLHHLRSRLKNEKFSFLIVDHIDKELRTIVPILLKLGALRNPNMPVETYVMYVHANDQSLLPLVLEAVDSTFSAGNRKTIVPLIDPGQDKIKMGLSMHPELQRPTHDSLRKWVESNQSWKLAIGLQYAIKTAETSLLDNVDLSHLDNKFGLSEVLNQGEYEFLRERIGQDNLTAHKEETLYSLLEKTFFLKTVELFRHIPGEILADIAQISEEIRYESEHVIFNEGAHGDHMFVVISGKVDIVQNGHTIAQLEKGSCIGEMALLDQEPRSADAKTTSEAVLLRIDQEGFYQLMASNSRIMQEIVKMLTMRIRQLNQKFTTELN